MKKSRKILAIALSAVFAVPCIAVSACGDGGESAAVELSAYRGENKDEKGRTVFNTDLFYSNQTEYGGPDPMVLDDTQRSGYYYLYSTLSNFHALRSKNLVEWDDVGPVFINTQSEEVRRATLKDNWAPEVIYDDDTGKYLIFFSATPEIDNTEDGANGIVEARKDYKYSYNMYLGISDSPAGPFVMANFEDEASVGAAALHNTNKAAGKVLNENELDGKTWVEQDGTYYEAAFPHYFAKYCYFAPDKLSAAIKENGWVEADGDAAAGYFGCIDPHPYVDPLTGEKILYFKAEDEQWNVLMAVKMKYNNWLTPDWSTFTYISADGYYTLEDWRNKENYGVSYELNSCNEGPFMIFHRDKNGDGKYYLSFSVNGYGESTYQVGTMVSDSPMGPFRKLTEEEGGLMICSSTTESQTISGAGHHSYLRVGGQEFVIYHRHRDFLEGGDDRYTAVDELKWIGVTDINGDYLEVPYLNGPTDSLQPIPEKYSEYKNIAPEAKVSCSDKNTQAEFVNDGLLSVHKTANEEFTDHIKEAKISSTSTFTFDFDGTQTVRAVMVYNAAHERDLFLNVSKIELVLPDGSVRVIKDVKYDIDEYGDYDEEINAVTYAKSGSAAFAEFYDINVKSVRVTVEVPEGQSSANISEIKILGKKTPAEVTENTAEYAFTNEEKFKAVPDSYVTIDGKFDEARWEQSNWLHITDRINDHQYAKISFTTFYGEKGVYFGMQVEEFGTTIFVNPRRESFINSSIEMYMAPATDANNSGRIFEFDFMADGSYKSKINRKDKFYDVKITGEAMPVVKATTIGGEINTPECTGYRIEAFFPVAFLEYVDYDVENLDGLELGINPVHIFSFDYDGKDLTQSRYWSDWGDKLYGAKWLSPSTYLKFGKDGFIGHELNVTTDGDGQGRVEEAEGNASIIPNGRQTLLFRADGSSTLTKAIVDGKDVTAELVEVGDGIWSYTFTEAVNKDIDVKATFAKK